MNTRLWIGTAVSAVLLLLSLKDVQFGAAWAYIQQINLLYLAPFGALLVFEVVVRSLRWQLILQPAKRCSFRGLTAGTLIGLMANNILPARAGEFVRAYAAARIERLAVGTVFATVVIDRILDGLTISAIFVFALALYPPLGPARAAGVAAGLAYLGGLAFLAALLTREDRTLRVVESALRRVRVVPSEQAARVVDALRSFADGLAVLRSPALLLQCVLLSVALWIGYALTVYALWPAFGIPLSVGDAFVVLIVQTIGLTVPSTPGFVGAIELAFVMGLGMFGVDPSQALAFALVYHIAQYIPHTLGGLLALAAERLSFTEIASAQSTGRQRTEPSLAR